MTFRERAGLKYFVFESLEAQSGLVHGLFTRRGGVSPSPWASLNVGGSVGDERERVRENRERCFRALGRPVESLSDLWLIHSDQVILAAEPGGGTPPGVRGDALISRRRDLTLFLRFADCVPVLLYDPRAQAVGLIHAGWKGSLLRVARKTVERMQEAFGTRPGDVIAAIGPSVAPDHYPVGEDVIGGVRQAFAKQADQLLPNLLGQTRFDLALANELALREAGVEKIEQAATCTACHVDDWYSHRSENGRTGRFGALIGLREG
ncbi:MAG: peptidoglycan editing factor PgeF [Anaerolineales bacterium]|jgi:YfiH family protein